MLLQRLLSAVLVLLPCLSGAGVIVLRSNLPNQGLVSYWFSRQSVAATGTWKDQRGNHNAALQADAYVTEGTGLIVDGTGDYASGGNITELASAAQVTMLYWVQKPGSANVMRSGSAYSSPADTFQLLVGTGDPNVLRIITPGSPTPYHGLSVAHTTAWLHLGGRFNGTLTAGSRMMVYQDGAPVGSTTNTAPTALGASTSSAWNIGMCDAAYGTGTIDQVMVFSRALADAEVAWIRLRTKK